MGLDATAYGQLVKIENPQLDEDGYFDGDGVQFYENTDFPGRMEGIEGRPTAYLCGEVLDCFSGGYGGYNGWREELAKLAGYPAAPVRRGELFPVEQRHDHGAFLAGAGPFYELIYFTDCDGTIGPVVSAKLAKDFAEFQSAADAHPNPIFRTRYADWRAGFELAAQGGAVKFS